MQQPIIVRRLGITDFKATWRDMQHFTSERNPDTVDEIWLTQHQAVYTLGLNRKQVRAPNRDDIPLVHTDRGGKITYHGPGQIIIYMLLDLKRNNLNIRSLVSLLENAVIELLASYQIKAIAKSNAPGVYVDDAKIASLGLRIKNNYCYHGLSLNVNMDLAPFYAIDPCGHVGLKVTQIKDLGIDTNIGKISELLLEALAAKLGDEHKYE